MGTFLSALLSVIPFFSRLMGWLQQKQAEQERQAARVAGQTSIVAEQQAGVIDAIQTGLEARRAQSAHDADHDRLHEDDGFKRPATGSHGAGSHGARQNNGSGKTKA